MKDECGCSDWRDWRSRLFILGLRPCPLNTEIPPDILNLLVMLCTGGGEISKSLLSFRSLRNIIVKHLISLHIC